MNQIPRGRFSKSLSSTNGNVFGPPPKLPDTKPTDADPRTHRRDARSSALLDVLQQLQRSTFSADLLGVGEIARIQPDGYGEHTVVVETVTEPVLSLKKTPSGPGQSLIDSRSSPDPEIVVGPVPIANQVAPLSREPIRVPKATGGGARLHASVFGESVVPLASKVPNAPPMLH